MTPRSRGLVVTTGLALIVMPLVALVVKLSFYPGWMMFVLIMSGVALLLGYALQIVIAVRDMLRARGVFLTQPGATRGLIAAWTTSVSVVLAAFFLVDGGDDGTYGSGFMVLVGQASQPRWEEISQTIMLVFAVIWLLSWLWLVIEWILLLVRARTVRA